MAELITKIWAERWEAEEGTFMLLLPRTQLMAPSLELPPTPTIGNIPALTHFLLKAVFDVPGLMVLCVRRRRNRICLAKQSSGEIRPVLNNWRTVEDSIFQHSGARSVLS